LKESSRDASDGWDSECTSLPHMIDFCVLFMPAISL
jgi:hypothetical protein